MTTGPVNGAGKPRVLHEYSFEVMSVDALPQGEIKTITPYWSNVLQELHRLPADKAIFFRHYSERPLTTEISKMRANFATQLRRYMPDAKLVVTRDVVRGGIFIHHAKEEAAPAADPDVDPDPVCSCGSEWRQLWEKGLRGPTNWTDRGSWHIVACALYASDGRQGLQQPDVEDEDAPDFTQDPDDLAAPEGPVFPYAFQGEAGDVDDEDEAPAAAAKRSAEPEAPASPLAAATSKRRGRLQLKPDEDPPAPKMKNGRPTCACPPWRSATPAFRRFAPDRFGPHHHESCGLLSSWKNSPDLPPCGCLLVAPNVDEYVEKHAGEGFPGDKADPWFQPGDHHLADCPRHVHRFQLPPAGSGSLGGEMSGRCRCGETKAHNNQLAGAGSNTGKPAAAATKAATDGET